MAGKLHLGTLIHGTLRNVDLLQAFAEELEQHEPDNALVQEAYAKVEAIEADDDADDEIASELVNDLQDALDDIAQQYGATFGNTEGDGSDFGFWSDDDSETE